MLRQKNMKLIQFARVSWRYMFAIFLSSILIGIFRSIPIYYFTRLVEGLPTFALGEILENSLFWTTSEIMSLLFVFAADYLLAKWRVKLSMTHKKTLLSQYATSARKGEENQFLDENSDVDTGINTLTSIYERITRAIFTIIFVGYVLAEVNFYILAIYLIGSFIMLITSNFFSGMIKELGKNNRTFFNKVSHFLQDMYNGLSEMRIRGRGHYFLSLFSQKNKEATAWGLKLSTLDLVANRLYQFFFVFLMSLVLFISGFEHFKSKIQIEDIAAIMVYGKLISGAVVGIINSIIHYRRNQISIDKYLELSQLDISEKHTENTRGINQFSPSKIQIHDLSVKVNENSIINNMNIEFNFGEITLITGENGVGKSTIFDYLFNNIDGTSKVNIFDKDNMLISDQGVKLKAFLSGMPQEMFLINDSIKNNIMLGKEIDAESAAILKDIEKLIGVDINRELSGLKTPLSGGQMRMVMLARCLVSPAPFLLLDEPTVYLDRDQKKYLIEKMLQLKEKHGIIIITHDDELYPYADNVFNVENYNLKKEGSIVE